jgi:pimeloyl-ACP methyl ester carboxylesterase
MTDIATQAKQLLSHSGSVTRRAVPRLCPLMARGDHAMIGPQGSQIAAWRLEGEDLGGPATLLVHGWEDDTSLWTPLVNMLQARGKAVVAFDLPAHGYSQGQDCTLASAARAIMDVAGALGPIDGVATHSFGGVALVQALLDGLDVPRVTLIAPPTEQAGQYERSWRRHGVSEALIGAALELGRAQDFFFDMAKIVGGLSQDALFVHSLDDAQCPADSARIAAAAWPHAKFWPVDGLGHRALVKDDEVVAMTAAWLAG